ncbi:MAG: hypothetical protein M3Y36_04175 [Actinomycetota bacterium]|nr:hypothetical protein [Actinomycetota bacterium]
MADADALRRYLEDYEGVFDDPAEGRGYLDDAFERFRLTLGMIPDLSPGARVLELGSNPYFLTRLLRRRGLDVTSANWFGADSGHHPRRPDVVVGVNDDLQMAGAHQLEGTGDDRWRWTGAEPVGCLLAAGADGAHSIRVEGVGPPVGPGRDLRLSIELAGAVVETMIAADGRPFTVELPVTAEAGDHVARLRTDATWRPPGGDPRSLGFRIKRVALEPAPDG